MQFVRANNQNNLLRKAQLSWEKQVSKDARRWLDNQMEYAAGIAAEDPADKRYGIYVLCHPNSTGEPRAPFEGFSHINHAYPNTSKPELRLVWGTLAPKYRDQTLSNTERATVMAAYIHSGIALSNAELPSTTVKLYLGAGVDKAFAKLFVTSVNPLVSEIFHAKVHGNWLHIDKV